MMYLKIENENGTINFAPMESDNIYVLCKDCGSMVRVNIMLRRLIGKKYHLRI